LFFKCRVPRGKTQRRNTHEQRSRHRHNPVQSSTINQTAAAPDSKGRDCENVKALIAQLEQQERCTHAYLDAMASSTLQFGNILASPVRANGNQRSRNVHMEQLDAA